MVVGDGGFFHTLSQYIRPMNPGGGSDVGGSVYLIDKRANRVITSGHVGLIWAVEEAEWSKTNVVIRLLFDWPLPSE